MWFLARSIFWLGVTFSYLDGLSLPDHASKLALQARDVAQACVTLPDVCRAAAQQFAPGAGPSVAAALPAKARSVDTLRPFDRALGWHGG